MERRGKDLSKLKKVLTLLIEETPLPERCRDHALVGNFSGSRDCHIEPDWLLIPLRKNYGSFAEPNRPAGKAGAPGWAEAGIRHLREVYGQTHPNAQAKTHL